MKTKPTLRSKSGDPRIAAIFPGALGDFICCLPAIESLSRKSEVDLFARSEFAGIAPERTTVYSLERREIAKLFTPNGTPDEQTKVFFSRYAAVFSWMGSGQSEFARQLDAVSPGTAHIYPFRTADSDCHQAEYYFRCLHENGPSVPDPHIGLRAEAIAWFDQFRARAELVERPLLVIAPGSGAREKNWPEDCFAAVADWWREHIRGAVVVLIGVVEEERGLSLRLQNAGVIVCGLDLAQAAALLAACDLFLGNDSGITHLAAACGTRTVALFGPSSPRQWAPRGARVMVVSRNENCAPCDVTTMKGCAHRRCLTGLGSDRVIAALAQLPEVATLTRYGAGITV